MAAGEQALAAELVAAMVVTVLGEIIENGEVPKPTQVLAVTLAYSILALIAMAGDDAARIASAFGALVLLVLLVRKGAQTFQTVMPGISRSLAAQAGSATATPPGSSPTNLIGNQPV